MMSQVCDVMCLLIIWQLTVMAVNGKWKNNHCVISYHCQTIRTRNQPDAHVKRETPMRNKR